MENMIGRIIACISFVIFALETCQASNSSKEQTTYDQKQKGDLNIHVHVSDVGILLHYGGSALGEYEDYDYSYDYYPAPIEDNNGTTSNSSTTLSPQITFTRTTTAEPSSTSISADDSTSSTTQPSTEVIKTNLTSSDTNNSTTDSISPNSTTTPKSTTKHKSTTTSTIKTTEKPKPTTTNRPKPSTTSKPKPSTTKPKPSTTTLKPGQKNQTISSTVDTSSAPAVTEGSTRAPEETPTTHISLLAMLLPAAHAPQEGVKKQGNKRRCGTGFYRDSRGRCRRIRKPNYQILQRLPIELPFGLRIAPRPVAGSQENTA